LAQKTELGSQPDAAIGWRGRGHFGTVVNLAALPCASLRQCAEIRSGTVFFDQPLPSSKPAGNSSASRTEHSLLQPELPICN
jgi:hypothetical protein